MKKLFAIISMVAFFGAIASPVFAIQNSNPIVVTVNDEKPKTKECDKKEAKKDCATPCSASKKAACDKEKK